MQKELYFTPETLSAKSQELLASVIEVRRRHSDILFRPNSAALLVLDLQKYFLYKSSHAFVPSAPATLPGISRLVTAFSQAGFPVILTRHLNTQTDAGMMANWWRDILNTKTAHSNIIPSIKPKKPILLNKTQYDAFYKTPLDNILYARGIEQVVVCGVMTHLCCETTARSAFMRGFEVFFTIDGTATYNEALHRATLMTLAHGFAIPVLIDELLPQMESYEA